MLAGGRRDGEEKGGGAVAWRVVGRRFVRMGQEVGGEWRARRKRSAGKGELERKVVDCRAGFRRCMIYDTRFCAIWNVGATRKNRRSEKQVSFFEKIMLSGRKILFGEI